MNKKALFKTILTFCLILIYLTLVYFFPTPMLLISIVISSTVLFMAIYKYHNL